MYDIKATFQCLTQLKVILLCVVDSWYDINVVWWEHMIYFFSTILLRIATFMQSIHFETNEQESYLETEKKLHEIQEAKYYKRFFNITFSILTWDDMQAKLQFKSVILIPVSGPVKIWYKT